MRKRLLAIRVVGFWKIFPVRTVEDRNPKQLWKQLYACHLLWYLKAQPNDRGHLQPQKP